MSKQYPGGLITKTPVTPSGPYADSTAPGIWTLEQQAAYAKQGNWPTAGNVNPNLFIENLFSTWLYSGNSSTQTITNGIDLSTKGGLVWIKARNDADDHNLYDTARGAEYSLSSNLTEEQTFKSNSLTAFNTTGFSLGSNTSDNFSSRTYASWTFRKQPKFFDVVTYTGNQVAGRTVAHNLGSVPGFIACKRTDTPDEWFCYHRSLGPSQQILLNSTATAGTNNNQWNNTAPTSSVFSLGTDSGANGTGGTYVAYLFAHNAGGFGLTGTDNVVSCGSFAVGGGSDGVVTLGYEPQWVMFKQAAVGGSGNWRIVDNMRGVATGGSASIIAANSSAAETSSSNMITFNATGFVVKDGSVQGGDPYVYIAIRRGPMAVPTTGTSVFTPVASRSSGTSQATPIFNAGFPVDTLITGIKAGGGSYWIPRLTVGQMTSSSTAAETSASSTYNFGGMLGILSASGDLSNSTVCGWNFKRAPSFHDVVCYTGTGSATTVTHNLGVAPELMIVKSRSNVANWPVYHSAMGNAFSVNLNGNGAASEVSFWNSTSPTTTVFSLDGSGAVNGSGQTYVAYLFATCAGVSKVGSYTGTGTTLQINCGFTTGARFVLIRRTGVSDGGDTYVWDSARGIVAGNDPYLLLNDTAAEVTNTDYVDTYSAGFEISSTAPAAINANGGTFIFLAIA